MLNIGPLSMSTTWETKGLHTKPLKKYNLSFVTHKQTPNLVVTILDLIDR